MLELGAFVILSLLAAAGIACLAELVTGGLLRESRRMVTVVLATPEWEKKRDFLRALDAERQNLLVNRVVVLDCGLDAGMLEKLCRWAEPKSDVIVCRPGELEAVLREVRRQEGL